MRYLGSWSSLLPVAGGRLSLQRNQRYVDFEEDQKQPIGIPLEVRYKRCVERLHPEMSNNRP